MYRTCVLTAAIVATLAWPAFAAAEFYIGENAKTHKCSVETTKPDGKTSIMIGKASFKTQAAADAAMKAAAECKAK
jgi:hypothetical protein